MVSFELVDPNGAELPAFSAGSHIDVTIPGGLVRQYSLCNSTSERNRYVIGVWNDGNSRVGPRRCMDRCMWATPCKSLARNRFRVPAVRNEPFCWQGASRNTDFEHRRLFKIPKYTLRAPLCFRHDVSRIISRNDQGIEFRGQHKVLF